nr:hypothetical protein [Gammaproteobacteria bacterium]
SPFLPDDLADGGHQSTIRKDLRADCVDGHVLPNSSLLDGQHRKVVVGSSCGHVSRNFIVDLNGHANVPRLIRNPAVPADAPCRSQDYVAELVEYGPSLREMSALPLGNYLATKAPSESHGIVSFTALADETFVFATHDGSLYHLLPLGDTKALLLEQGYLHPDGAAHVTGLFSPDGARFIAGVGRTRGGKFSWLRRDLKERRSAASELTGDALNGVALLYGSMARDPRGTFYVAGRKTASDGSPQPTVLQIRTKMPDGG